MNRFDSTCVKYRMALFYCGVRCWTENVKIQFWKRKVGQKSAWDHCLNTVHSHHRRNASKQVLGFPSKRKASVLLSSSQTRVQISGDIRRQQVPEHNSCCCCDSLAPKLPRGAWCQSWFGFITYPVLHICKVCYGRKWNVTMKRLGGRQSYVMKEAFPYPPPFFFQNVHAIWFPSWMYGKNLAGITTEKPAWL